MCPGLGGVTSCTFVGRRRKESHGIIRLVPEHRLNFRSHPTQGPMQLPTALNQRQCWAMSAWSCLFPARFSQLPFHTFALFPEMGKVSSSNSLVAIDPIFQTKKLEHVVWCENI